MGQIKRTLKKSVIFKIVRIIKIRLVLIQKGSEKKGISTFRGIFFFRFYGTNYKRVFANVTIKNEGYGDFFYSIDETMIRLSDKSIISNIPVDYSYLLNCEFSRTGIFESVDNFVRRINDSRIKLTKPKNIKEALQAILFWNSLLWQTGHKLVGLGRLDKVLDPYPLSEDIEQLICDFLRTLHCKYDYKSNKLKGDTGQIIILGGLEADGSYFANKYTYLFIESLIKINIPDPKILLRVSQSMPEDLLKLAVKCVSTGIGSPLFSNDDVVIPHLIDFGYERADAYNYGVSACWEPLSIGNSLEQNNLANIEFGRYVNETIVDLDFLQCKDFDSVLNLYFSKLHEGIDCIIKKLDAIVWEKDPVISWMMGLKKDIADGGAKYNNYGILSVGMSSAINSLLNIKMLVFNERKYTLNEIQKVVKTNYEFDIGNIVFSENKHGYGTDSKDAVELTNLVIHRTEQELKNYKNMFGGKVKFGLSSPEYIDCSKYVGATLDGRKSGTPFQTHISRDKGEALTEIVNFESKLKFTGTSSNANVIDIMLQRSLIKDNIDKFVVYILGGIKQGIFQIQINVLSYTQLVEAKAYPGRYPNLIVRVWGFSAYFNDLPEEYKDNLIRRAKEMEQIA